MNHIQYVLSFSDKPYPVPLFHSLWVLHTWTHTLKSVRLFNYNCALNAHHTLLNDRQAAGEQSIFFRQLFFQLFLTHVYLFLFCLLCWFSRPFILGIEKKRARDLTSLLGYRDTLSSSFCSPVPTACSGSFCESFSGSSLHTNERTGTITTTPTHIKKWTIELRPHAADISPPINQH